MSDLLNKEEKKVTETQKPEEIVLTLGTEKPEAEVLNAEKPAAELKKYSKEEIEAAKQIDESRLTPEEKQQVVEFSKTIDVLQTNAIIKYGAAAQDKVSSFSTSALDRVKTKDLDAVGNSLESLVSQLKGFDANKPSNGVLTRLFKKGANKVSDLKIKYDSANKNVEKITNILEDHQTSLMKDSNVLDQLFDKNIINLKELTMYISAGYKKLETLKTVDLPAAQKKAEETKLPEDVQAAADLDNAITRFEKRVHDLEITRVVSAQMLPQIRLVQNNNSLMTEKIQSTLANTIPLWKSHMLIALGLSHSAEAIKAENAVNEMTNQMLKKNAENLKIATIDTAKEAERSIVDIQTLTETNQKLIETLEEVKKIQAEGKEARENARVELRKVESELKEKLSDIVLAK